MPRPLLNNDPELDLLLERVVDIPRHLVWAAWTKPENVVKWFTPAPWVTSNCQIDLQPGGIFQTVMRGPDTPPFTNTGCFLQVVDQELLAWTGALGPGFRPLAKDTASHLPFVMTAIIALEDSDRGTRYTAIARHGDYAARLAHEQMGFHAGWNKALDQLVEAAKAGQIAA